MVLTLKPAKSLDRLPHYNSSIGNGACFSWSHNIAHLMQMTMWMLLRTRLVKAENRFDLVGWTPES